MRGRISYDKTHRLRFRGKSHNMGLTLNYKQNKEKNVLQIKNYQKNYQLQLENYSIGVKNDGN